MERKYFGRWSDHKTLVEAFTKTDYNWESDDLKATETVPGGIATDDEILFASYGGGDYEGDALVLYQRDGQLYEVHGSHCSCHGLEDSWEPEATTWAALAKRQRPTKDEDGWEHWHCLRDHDPAAITAYWMLVDTQMTNEPGV